MPPKKSPFVQFISVYNKLLCDHVHFIWLYDIPTLFKRYIVQREALDAVAISVLKSNFKLNPKKGFWGFNGIRTRDNPSRKTVLLIQFLERSIRSHSLLSR